MIVVVVEVKRRLASSAPN